MKNKEIILIAFHFPPFGGVGTRRWSKFAKYLARDGYIVNVITKNYPYFDKNQNFLEDIKDKNIIVHTIDFDYPYFVIKQDRNIFLKIISKLYEKFINPIFYPFGIAQGWEKYLLPYTKKLIREKSIQNVIVTSPPGVVAYYASFLKIDIPSINLILDFRDPWASMSHYDYGTNLKKFPIKEKIVQMEKMAIELSNIVVNVSDGHSKNFELKYSKEKDKFITIFNGYDRDDIEVYSQESQEREFTLLYAGSFGLENRAEGIRLIVSAIKELNDDFINKNFKVILFTTAKPSNFSEFKYFDIIKRNFIFKKYIPKKEIMKEMSRASFCLSINGPNDSDAMGTKIYEYFSLKKKILHISNGGELSKILLDSGENYVSSYNIEIIKKQLLLMKEDYQNGNLNVKNLNFYKNFDIEKLVKKYEDLFI